MKNFQVGEFGIENTMEVIKFGATLTILGHGLKNGFQVTEEVPNLIAAGSAALPALEDFQTVDDEILDLSVDEEQVLVNYTDSLLAEMNFIVDDTRAAIKDFVNAAILAFRGSLRLKPKE